MKPLRYFIAKHLIGFRVGAVGNHRHDLPGDLRGTRHDKRCGRSHGLSVKHNLRFRRLHQDIVNPELTVIMIRPAHTDEIPLALPLTAQIRHKHMKSLFRIPVCKLIHFFLPSGIPVQKKHPFVTLRDSGKFRRDQRIAVRRPGGNFFAVDRLQPFGRIGEKPALIFLNVRRLHLFGIALSRDILKGVQPIHKRRNQTGAYQKIDKYGVHRKMRCQAYRRSPYSLSLSHAVPPSQIRLYGECRI